MPYKLSEDGKCVVNSDTGATVKGGCHDTHEQALAHMKALYANVPDASKEVDPLRYATATWVDEFGTEHILRMKTDWTVKEVTTTPSDTSAHGPGGILSQPGQGSDDKKKKKKFDMVAMFNAMLAPKSFSKQLNLTEKDFAYAAEEAWHVDALLQAMSILANLMHDEAEGGETENVATLNQLMDALSAYMQEQKGELVDATKQGYETKESKGESSGTGGHGGYLVTDAAGNKHLPTESNGKRDHRLMAAARAALTSNYRGHSYQGPDKSAAISKLKKMYEAEGMDWNEKESSANSTFLIEKDAQGKVRWTLFSGSAFMDRDFEIISEKALQSDCDAMELTGDYGELLWWHCDGAVHGKEKEARPYIPLGQCDFSMVQDKINIESGTFYDEAVGLALLSKSKELGASKSFYHAEDEPKDGVYYHIRTKERSLMPRARESNLLTRLFGSKEKEMADNAERVDALKGKIGAEATEKLLAQAKELSAKAEQFLASKEMKKKKPADDEEAETKPDDEAAEGETMKKKEFEGAIASMKEQNDALQLTLKEQGEKMVAMEKSMSDMQSQLNQASRLVSALYGVQPKGSGFRASAAKETETDLSGLDEKVGKLATESEKTTGDNTAADPFAGLANFVITGNKGLAAF